jgi:hypothetical protein
MADHHRRADKELVQQILLLDDPEFLRRIVERTLQQLLEAEITEHVGAAPYQRTESRKGHRNGHKPRKLKTQGPTPWPSRAPGPGGRVLHPAFRPLPEKREGPGPGTYGDVRRGGLHQECWQRSKTEPGQQH